MATSDEIKLIVSAEVGKATAEIKKLQTQLGKVDKDTKATNSTFGGLNSTLLKTVTIMAGVTAAYKFLVKPASDLNEQHSKFTVVFQENATAAEKWKETLVESYAMSSREAYEYMSQLGGLLKPMGLSGEAALEMSGNLTKLAADMASFNNVDISEALIAIRAGLVGETEPLRRLSVTLSQARIEQEALNMKVWDGKGAIDAKAKALATYNIILKDSALAQGDMIRTGDSWANIQKKVLARIEDIGAQLGANLLPALGALGNAFLRATQNGGVLTKAFEVLLKAMSWIIKAAANIIEAFNYINESANTETAREEYRKLGMENLKLIEDMKKFAAQHGMTTGNVVQNVQKIMAAEKNKSSVTSMIAAKYIGEYNAQMKAQRELEGGSNKHARAMIASSEAIQKNMQADATSTSQAIVNQESLAYKFQETENRKKEASKMTADQQMQAMITYSDYVGEKVEAELIQEQIKYEQLLAMYGTHLEARAELEAVHEERSRNIKINAETQKAQQYLQIAQQATNGVMNILNQEQKFRETKMANRYNKEKALLGAVITDEETRKQAMEALDLMYERKKRQMRRETAMKEKAVAMVQAGINTALAVTSALTLIPPASYIMAALSAAMGAIQIAMIGAMPIPAAAEGALIKGSAEGTMIKAGEAGRSEMIVPFENDEVMSRVGPMGGGGGVSIQIDNLYAAGDAVLLATELDRAFFRMWQDKRSLFANALLGR